MDKTKNMFSYKIRRVQDHKESNIIPNDPSNIFEFKTKKRKNIDFNIMVSPSKNDIKKTNFENDIFRKLAKPIKRLKVEDSKKTFVRSHIKNTLKALDKFKTEKHTEKIIKKSKSSSNFIDAKSTNFKSKKENNNKYLLLDNKNKFILQNRKLNVKKVDFDNFLKQKPSAEENKHILKKPYNSTEVKLACSKNEFLENFNEISGMSDVLMLFCNENLNDKYAKKLKIELQKNKEKFDNVKENIEESKNKIEEINEEFNKWSKIKEDIYKKNILNTIKIENNQNADDDNNVNDEVPIDFSSIDKLKFIKNSINVFASNLSKRVDELEEQMFDLNKEETGLDSMILLQGLIKFK